MATSRLTGLSPVLIRDYSGGVWNVVVRPANPFAFRGWFERPFLLSQNLPDWGMLKLVFGVGYQLPALAVLPVLARVNPGVAALVYSSPSATRLL